MNKNSPNLEVVSSSGGPASETGPERRRLPRLNLSGEQFRLSSTGKIFSVTDLSTGGMALRILDRQDFLLFPIAAALSGSLNLGGEKHAVSARVRHLGAETVGCEFDGLSVDTRAVLERFLDPTRLGAELKPIPSEGSNLWYHGPSGTDLLLKRGFDGQYQRMSLYVLGSYVQWTEDAGLVTGGFKSADDQAETRGVLRFETHLLSQDPKVDSGKLKVAKTLILGSNLPEDFKKWCTRKLEV